MHFLIVALGHAMSLVLRKAVIFFFFFFFFFFQPSDPQYYISVSRKQILLNSRV